MCSSVPITSEFLAAPAFFSTKNAVRSVSQKSLSHSSVMLYAASPLRDCLCSCCNCADLLWSFAPAVRPSRPRTLAEVPAISPESVAMAKELKRRGFAFVGPTTAYALMQATGMVDDHVVSCFRAASPERS